MMKSIASALLIGLIGFGSFATTAAAENTADKDAADKYYLFIGKMDTLPISSMVANPHDTFPGYAKEMDDVYRRFLDAADAQMGAVPRSTIAAIATEVCGAAVQ